MRSGIGPVVLAVLAFTGLQARGHDPRAEELGFAGTFELGGRYANGQKTTVRLLIEPAPDATFRLSRFSDDTDCPPRKMPRSWVSSTARGEAAVLVADYRVPCDGLGALGRRLLRKPDWDVLRARYEVSSEGGLTESVVNETRRCLSAGRSSIEASGIRKDFPYPILAVTDVPMDIDFYRWTVKRGDGKKNGLEWLGRPLELCFFCDSYARIASDGRWVHLEPHYEQSAWDYFGVDGEGKVTANGVGGLVFWDLNKNRPWVNRAGMIDVLTGAAEELEKQDPVPPEAATLRTIVTRIPR
jgi:hypothetical protein